MKSLKTVLLGTAAVAGLGILLGGQDALADEAYTVQSGDTLSVISYNFFGNTEAIDKIVEANDIKDKNLIYVGEKLTIPTDGQQVVSQEPVEETYYEEPVEQSAPVVEESYSEPVQQAPAQQYQSSASGSEASAKEWIANKESGGSYSATNGQYIGRYQLTNSYLNGDYSEANQEKVADEYVNSRYGSWSAAKSFWEANGWY
ncbi:MAG TPA: LysM peptidoglycan-binding domain-containing protein [Candidatus Tetragenococcus pullicola]|nr:LysM peptidoglycan-binding domain-containing protein [Candidatus Tetragenococcus pullicola]